MQTCVRQSDRQTDRQMENESLCSHTSECLRKKRFLWLRVAFHPRVSDGDNVRAIPSSGAGPGNRSGLQPPMTAMDTPRGRPTSNRNPPMIKAPTQAGNYMTLPSTLAQGLVHTWCSKNVACMIIPEGISKPSLAKLRYACSAGTRGAAPFPLFPAPQDIYCMAHPSIQLPRATVQSERKPFDVQREKPTNCAASTEKIYIRKDLRSPLIATPTFVADKDGTRQTGLLDPGMLVNIQQPLIRDDGTVLLAADSKAETSQGALGTLANVVTSLANLNESLNNGDPSEIQQEDQSASEITRAFDTLAKALNTTDGSSTPNLADGMDPTGGGNIHVISRDQSTPIIEVEGPLLTDTHVTFKLTMPSPMPEYLNVHYICESASRLLFLSMHWARSIPAFQALGQDCNTSLVRACWNELFTLGLAQCSQVMSLSTILAAIVNHLQNSIQEDKLSGDRIKQVMEHIWKLQEFCNSMAKLDIDGYEYAYLKAIVLFSPDHPGLTSTSQIEKFQEKAQMELQDYVQKTYSEDTYRLARILVRLPALRLMSSSITEELFFTGLIGNVSIDSIIPYILKMETAEYNGQITGTNL
ncbi:nuclear receptor subfamily 2 group C member 2-like [Gracilinanus agilis]|uniref:nuclear receptor subfamily 2 group C member 2-like n=1 Tax=Gracilinanus agilis TaxID=191870 RepID=UPI001CFC4ADF|nr:nuclear receptor subfamily 2 group C member 2-like [Gracilinanus agilis]